MKHSPPFLTGRALCRIAMLFACLFLLPPPAQAAASPSIVDDAGKTVTLASPAQRIIPLYAGLSETLAALGLESRIVGRTASDNSVAQDIAVVGTHMRPNPELIIGLAPDLVIQFEGREEAGATAEMLAHHGIAIARFRINSFASLFSCIERIGVLTGSESAANALTAEMQSRLEAVGKRFADRTEKPSVFFEVRYPNLLGAGGGSMLTDIITAAGGVNCLSTYSERMVRLSEEALLMQNPSLYLIQQGPMNKNPIPLAERDHFQNLQAVTNGFSRFVPEALYSRTGPQSVNAVEDLANYIDSWHKANAAQTLSSATSGAEKASGGTAHQ